ncbi:hypothetical protein Holit_03323 [Hollandina sp. SP2]
MVATDDRDRFLSAFGEDNQVIGKEHTGDRGKPLPTEAQGTEGNKTVSLKKGIKLTITTSDLDNTKEIIDPVNNHGDRQIIVSVTANNYAPIIIDSKILSLMRQDAKDEYTVFDKR